LLENSIDAWGDRYQSGVKKGGCQSIKVIDNGSGIEHDDVPLVFERHATSKIINLTIYLMLYRLVSWRSNAQHRSVARVELLTRRKNDLSAPKQYWKQVQ